MPLFFVLTLLLIFSQSELSFFFSIDYFCHFFVDLILHPIVLFFSSYNFVCYESSSLLHVDLNYQRIDNLKIEYNYNYRTYFSQTYLHAAYNKHIKPYKNLLSADRLFGDYNSRTFGKSKKHARATKHTKLFLLLYSHTLDCFAFNSKLVGDSTLFLYFKRHHFYSALEMFYASIYLGMIYFLSFTYTRMVEDSSLNYRETEEIDEEDAQNHWYYYREDRRGVFEPAIEDNVELDFAYPQHPVEWDDNGHFYRWEMHFFIFLFSFLICWGVSQSAASMFFYDNFIDLHFMAWATTFVFIFIFWRIFFFVQFFLFFNRFNFRKFFQLSFFLPLLSNLFSLVLKFFYSYFFSFFFFLFFKILKLNSLLGDLNDVLARNLGYFSKLNFLKSLVLSFYKFLYSFFQKNLNFFEKRNFYDFILSSNLLLFFNSRSNIDNLNFFGNDRIIDNIYAIAESYIDGYGFNRGYYFPKNMYLTDNKITFPWLNLIPTIFPLYLDFFNVNDLPIWGADFYFSQNEHVFGTSESYESWFFNNQYNKNFGNLSTLMGFLKKKDNYFFL